MRAISRLMVWTGLSLLAFAPTGMADDLTGKSRLLCSAIGAAECLHGGECAAGGPWEWGIPQFLEVDLDEGILSTTPASGQNRITKAGTIERSDGQIFVQGVERGRAYSFVIDETSGLLYAAIARNGSSISVFGACTPREDKE